MNQLYRCLCLEPSQVEEIQSYAARHGEADLESIAPELGDQSWKIGEEHSRASLPVTPSFMSRHGCFFGQHVGHEQVQL